jgi:hypothetical protein
MSTATRDGDLNLTVFESRPSGENLQFSKQARCHCVAYLRRKFVEHTHSENTMPTISFAHQRHWLPVTSFHIALLYDEQFAKDVLKELTEDEAKYLLTALVDFKEFHEEDDSREELEILTIGLDAAVDWSRREEENKSVSFHLPLALAMCTRGKDFLNILIYLGANIQQTDLEGNNIMHSLVEFSARHPKKAVEIYNSLIHEVIQDRITTQKLLFSANERNCTPLDYASELCLPEMMHAIINTQGIYKFLIRHCGTHVHSLYDVTHDETSNEDWQVSPPTVVCGDREATGAAR